MPLANREFLTIGPAHSITQNTVYGLPARVVRVHSSLAVEVSYDGTTFDALTGGETTGAECAAAFLRCPTGAATITLKAY